MKQVGLDKYCDGVAFLFRPSSKVDLVSVDKVSCPHS